MPSVALKPVALLILQKAMRWGISGKRRLFFYLIFFVLFKYLPCALITVLKITSKAAAINQRRTFESGLKGKQHGDLLGCCRQWRWVATLKKLLCAGVGELLSRGPTWQSNVLQKSSLGWIGVGRLVLSQWLWTARGARMRTWVVLMQERAEGKRWEWEWLERTH